jgi:hypothetical protein
MVWPISLFSMVILLFRAAAARPGTITKAADWRNGQAAKLTHVTAAGSRHSGHRRAGLLDLAEETQRTARATAGPQIADR